MSLKKFKKALALFLCLCLFSGTVSLGASAEENAVDSAAAELKTAWQNMTETVSSNFYPLAYHINDNFNGDLGSIFYGSETAPFDATYKMLGQYYAKFNFIAANQEAHLIGFFKDKQHHSYGDADLTQYKDMYFYLYISNVNVQGTIKPVFFDQTERKNITGKEIAIDESVVGKWIKISAADMFDGGYDYVKTSLDNSMKIVRISVGEGLDADAVLGSIMFEKSVSLPENADSMSAAELLAAADAVDTSALDNTEAFINAHNALRVLLTTDIDYLTENLKQKWAAMTEYSPSDFTYMQYHNGSDFLGKLERISYNSETAPYEATREMLGDYYTSFNLKEADRDARLIGIYNNEWRVVDTYINLSQYLDLYFYIYVSEVNSSGSITPVLIKSKGGETKLEGKPIAIDESAVGKWTKVSFADMFDYGYEYICSALSNEMNIFRLSVSEGIDAQIVLGSIVFEKNVSLPENSEYWNRGDWFIKAEKLDTSKYGNTAAFKESVEALGNAVKTTDDYTVALIKDAWSKMYSKVSSNFYPIAYHKDGNFPGNMLDYKAFNSETAPEGTSFEMLGSYYAELNFNIASETGARLIGYFRDRNCGYGEADLTQYSDMYFYFYVSEVSVPGTVKPVFFDKTERKNITGKEIAIDESVVGKWIKISAADMFDGGYDYVKSSLGNSLKIVRLSVSDGLNADAVIGSIMFEKQSTELPLLTTNAQYMKKAQELDANAYGNTEEFLSLLSTNRAGHCRSDETMDITDLIRLKKYLASTKDGNDSTVEINKIAADVNFDEEINAQDLAALRKLLLG